MTLCWTELPKPEGRNESLSHMVLQLRELTPHSIASSLCLRIRLSLNRLSDWTQLKLARIPQFTVCWHTTICSELDERGLIFELGLTGGETQLQAKCKLTGIITILLICGADKGVMGLELQKKKSINVAEKAAADLLREQRHCDENRFQGIHLFHIYL